MPHTTDTSNAREVERFTTSEGMYRLIARLEMTYDQRTPEQNQQLQIAIDRLANSLNIQSRELAELRKQIEDARTSINDTGYSGLDFRMDLPGLCGDMASQTKSFRYELAEAVTELAQLREENRNLREVANDVIGDARRYSEMLAGDPEVGQKIIAHTDDEVRRLGAVIAELREAMRWRDVSDSPDQDAKYLVDFGIKGGPYYGTARFTQGQGWNADNVIRWLPIPPG